VRFGWFNAGRILASGLIAGRISRRLSRWSQGWPEATPAWGVALSLAAAGGYWARGTGWVRAGFLLVGSGRRRAGVAGAQPYLGPRDRRGLGDMMMDGVACQVWPRQSFRAVRSGGVAAGLVWGVGHGQGHGAPTACGLPRLARCRCRVAGMGVQGLVAEAAQDVVGAAGELAGDGQGGAVGVDPGSDVSLVGLIGGSGAGSVVTDRSQLRDHLVARRTGSPRRGRSLVQRPLGN
jgi:hypothetical protein